MRLALSDPRPWSQDRNGSESGQATAARKTAAWQAAGRTALAGLPTRGHDPRPWVGPPGCQPGVWRDRTGRATDDQAGHPLVPVAVAWAASPVQKAPGFTRVPPHSPSPAGTIENSPALQRWAGWTQGSSKSQRDYRGVAHPAVVVAHEIPSIRFRAPSSGFRGSGSTRRCSQRLRFAAFFLQPLSSGALEHVLGRSHPILVLVIGYLSDLLKNRRRAHACCPRPLAKLLQGEKRIP